MNNEDRIQTLTREIDTRMTELETMKNKIEAEKRSPNDEERARKDVIFAEVAALSADLTQEKKEVEIRRGLTVSLREPTRPMPDHLDERQRKWADQGITLPPKEMRFDTFGEQVRAMVTASRPGGIVDRRLTRAATGLGEQFPSDGGFLVQQDFSAELMRRAYERSQIVSRVRKINISSNSNSIKINGVAESSRASTVWGGIVVYWLDEGGAKTPTTPQFEQITLTLNKLAGLCYASDELVADAALLESIINDGFAEALDVELERVIIRGTGAGQPLGILNAACLITQAAEDGQGASTIVYDNVVKMWARLHARSMPNSVWACSQSIMPQLLTMYLGTGASGTPVFLPPGGATAAPYGTIFGRPLIPIENCSALGTVGDLILFDPTQYLFASKNGIQTATSIHVRFVNDELTFRIVFRCDGQPAWSTTLTPKDSSNTVSPFVTLATRS